MKPLRALITPVRGSNSLLSPPWQPAQQMPDLKTFLRERQALNEPSRKEMNPVIRTFRKDRLLSVKQPIVDLSSFEQPRIGIPAEMLPTEIKDKNRSLTPHYHFHTEIEPFPSGTRGVFYFQHVPGDLVQSQIRFRLCSTLDDFHHGADLRRSDGTSWHINLKEMSRAPEIQYAATLAVLHDEFSILDDRNANSSQDEAHRFVSCLDPRTLPSSSQTVIDISGLSPLVHFGNSDMASLDLQLHYTGDSDGREFPPYTIGVFYYKKSRTAKRRIGELRFRLCEATSQFHGGKDLLDPSGVPWSLSSLEISARQKYQHLRRFLHEENLLEDHGFPVLPPTLSPTPIVPLRGLGESFVLDLSSMQCQVAISSPKNARYMSVDHVIIQTEPPDLPLFRGRVVVQLQQYPGMAPHSRLGPVLHALRVVELLTPVQRIFKGSIATLKTPTEDQLLYVYYGTDRPFRKLGIRPLAAKARPVVSQWDAPWRR